MTSIVIVGLGPGGWEGLSQGTLAIMKGASRIFLRTSQHPVVPGLRKEGILFDTFDYLYDQEEEFCRVYQGIARRVLEEAASGPVVYAVPGNPMVAESSVREILAAARGQGIEVEVHPAMSFLDPLFPLLGLDPCGGLKIIDALELDKVPPDPAVANLVLQVYNRLVASEVKLTLMEYYPDEFQIAVVRAAGVPGEEKAAWIPLYELDRQDWIDHLTTIYLPPNPAGALATCQFPMDRLVGIMATLRGPEGCPWDREQTHQSLKKYLIEETYEVLEAIDEGNMYKICEELGDLLLQIIFHAQIAREAKAFDLNDIARGLAEKLIRRHPHVFGDGQAKTSSQVVAAWEAIKKEEQAGRQESYLAGVPSGLPALLRAEKLQKKAAQIGFDWPDYRGALDKVHEELAELGTALRLGQEKQIKEELGDLLFALVNLARLLRVDAEEALRFTNLKFVERFGYMEKAAATKGLDLASLSLAEMDRLWEEAKKGEDS